MNILIVGGEKTQNVVTAISHCFAPGSVDFLVEANIGGIERFFDSGHYFDRAVITDAGVTLGIQPGDLQGIRKRLSSFVSAIQKRTRNTPRLVFICGSEEIAQVVYEETGNLEATTKVLLAKPPYNVAFMVAAASSKFDALSEWGYVEYLEKKRQEELEEAEKAAKERGSTQEGFEVAELGELMGAGEAPRGNVRGAGAFTVAPGDLGVDVGEDDGASGGEDDGFEVGDLGLDSDEAWDGPGAFEGSQEPEGKETEHEDIEIETQAPKRLAQPKIGLPVKQEPEELEEIEETDENFGEPENSTDGLEGGEGETIGDNGGFGDDGFDDSDWGDSGFSASDFEESEPSPEDQFAGSEDGEDWLTEPEVEQPAEGVDFGKDDDGFEVPNGGSLGGEGDVGDGNDEPKEYEHEPEIEDDGFEVIEPAQQELTGAEELFGVAQSDKEWHMETPTTKPQAGENLGEELPAGFEDDMPTGFGEDAYEDTGKPEEVPAQVDETPKGLDGAPIEIPQPEMKSEKHKLFGRKQTKPGATGGQGQKNNRVAQQRAEKAIPRTDSRKAQQVTADLETVLKAFKLRGHIVTVTGLPSSGKTTVISNLANVATKMGCTVLMADFDVNGRGLAISSKKAFEAVHSQDISRCFVGEAANGSANLSTRASILAPGFHLLTTGLGADPLKPDWTTPEHLSRFCAMARGEYQLIFMEVPWDFAIGAGKTLLFNSDDIVITTEMGNHDLMGLLLRMGNIEDNATEELLWSQGKILFTKVNGLGSLFGKNVGGVKSLLKVMDDQLTDLAGEEAAFYFSDMHVVGQIPFDTSYEACWLGKSTYTDEPRRRDMYLETLRNVLIVRD